jgi:alpha-tubulin suppressor-like RCC1 family protein
VIKVDGLAWCVGSNFYSQLTHDGETSAVLSAHLFSNEPARAIAAGFAMACFVSCATGETKCAGAGTSGQLGNGQTTDSTALVIATGLSSDVCTTSPTTVKFFKLGHLC